MPVRVFSAIRYSSTRPPQKTDVCTVNAPRIAHRRGVSSANIAVGTSR